MLMSNPIQDPRPIWPPIWLSSSPAIRSLGMDLAQGGQPDTWAVTVNFSGIIFRAFSYGVDRQTGLINYAAVRQHRRRMCVPVFL